MNEKVGEPVMSEELDPSRILKDNDCIWYKGQKYVKIETPQSFYDKLWCLLKEKLGDTVDCDEMADRVRDLIRENIPEPKIGPRLSEYAGFNEAIRQVKMGLFNGIQ